VEEGVGVVFGFFENLLEVWGGGGVRRGSAKPLLRTKKIGKGEK